MQQHNIKVANKPINKLQQIKTKDSIKNKNKTNVVYKINWRDCPLNYIGQTKNG